MANLPYPMLKEQIQRQNRNISLHYSVYNDQKNVKRAPITSKFWIKQSGAKIDSVLADNYLKLIEKDLNDSPKDKYSEPMVESHLYGWIPGPFIKNYDDRDFKLLHYPRNIGDITRVGEKIAAEKQTQIRPKWTGLPFKLS